MSRKRVNMILVCCLLLIAFVPEVQAQCAMCKQAAATSMKSNPNSMARSLNSGILYLMAVPYLAICFIFRKQIASLYRKLKAKMIRPKPADQLP